MTIFVILAILGCPLIFLICIIYIFMSSGLIKRFIFQNQRLKSVSENFNTGEFDVIYEHLINNPNIKDVENEYKKNRLKLLIGIIAITLGIIVILSAFFRGIDNIEANAVLAGFCILIGAVFLMLRKTVSYKSEIIKNLIFAIDPNIHYEGVCSELIYETLYLEAEFTNKTINQYKADDYMEFVTNDGAKVQLADLYLQEYIKGTHRTPGMTIPVFSGIAVKITREKMINSEFMIKTNSMFKDFNGISSNTEIGKYVNLYGVDKFGNDVVLTERVRVTLLNLIGYYGILFHISIKQNCIYICFFMDPVFEYKGVNLIDKKHLYKEYVIFKSILHIVNKINEIF